MSSRFGLEIRAATAGDTPGLAELLAASGLAATARALAARLERLQRGQGTALLALEWGPPSGVIVVHWWAGLAGDHLTAEVSLLLVGADARRRGLARLLLKAASQAARSAGCHEIGLAVPPGQAEMLAFAASTGFAPDGARLRRNLRRAGREADT